MNSIRQHVMVSDVPSSDVHQRTLVSHDQRGLSWPLPKDVMVAIGPINVPWSHTTSVVSHDHHLNTLWSHSNPSTFPGLSRPAWSHMTTTKLYVTGRKPASVPLIQRFQIQMVTNDHTTELQIIPHYPAGDDSNNTTVKTSQMDRPQSRTRPIRRSGQMSKGGFST